MQPMRPEPVPLARLRRAIDGIDHALLLLLAARARLARRAERCKRDAGLPMRDPAREARVHARAQALAVRIGLPAATARRAIGLAIDVACREQGIAFDLDQGGTVTDAGIMAAEMDTAAECPPRAARLLRLLPPPSRLAPWLRALPPTLQQRLLERAMARVLAAPIADGALDFMRGRRLGIDVTDLDLHWVIELRDGQLTASGTAPEASVRGSATDLLLLASRLEDADTLFFQRRLVLTGDTELGLTARNVLERLPWESVPLGLRIVLNRGARLARDARAAYHGNA
jgi:predicted lipid carrier protein YhbT/chorismate mutase